VRLPEIEAQAQGRVPDAACIAELAAAAAAAIAPEDTVQVPATFRRELVETLVARAFHAALNRESRA